MNSNDIIALLAKRHEDDVFVTECYGGPSYGDSGRMDAWAMRRSWAKACALGYEVKVSRSDFLNDDKWHKYLECCNEFYWVCPWGLIQENEVGEGAGLIYVTKTGSRLLRKVKATHRKGVPGIEKVLRSIVINRFQVSRHQQEGGKEYWQRWMNNRRIDRDFGWSVGKAIREQIEKEIISERRRNDTLESRLSRLDAICEYLKKIGIDPENPPAKWTMEAQIERARQAIPEQLSRALENAQSEIEKLHKRVRVIVEKDDD